MGILHFRPSTASDSGVVASQRLTALDQSALQKRAERGQCDVLSCDQIDQVRSQQLYPPPPPLIKHDQGSVRNQADCQTDSLSPHQSSLLSRHHTSTNRRSSLGELAGVRQSDTTREEHRLKRDRPRLTLRPIHAMGIILLLAMLLCASLTMLIGQAIRYEHAMSTTHSSTDLGASNSNSEAEQYNETDSSERDITQHDADNQTETQDTTPAPSNAAPSDDSNEAETAPTNEPVNDDRIDLNTASSEELQTINGIGPVTADRIITHRKSIGRFTSVDQLLDVKGIGAKTLAKIRDQVVVR
ncbi:competence protein ComEA [Bifidobacterium hapali]|uniref:Competence protein ComEA n=1 Tax=Bifidobacterium hapali TaxID=1630172 RepID=A0A261FUJ9_9BIFI|nr:competence protein ComEA [Bifidobacterium hapali]